MKRRGCKSHFLLCCSQTVLQIPERDFSLELFVFAGFFLDVFLLHEFCYVFESDVSEDVVTLQADDER